MTGLTLAKLLGLDDKTIAWINVAPADVMFALDCDGRVIRREDYGKLTEYGWEIDHAHPTALGGSGHHTNLRARHWRGNRSAGGLLGGLMNLGK